VKPVRWTPFDDGRHGRERNVVALLTAHDGTLWIVTNSGIVSWKAGTFVEHKTPTDVQFGSIAEDREGRIWLGSVLPAPGRVCLVQQTAQCSDAGGRLGTAVTGLLNDSSGRLWAGSIPGGLVRWKPEPPQFFDLSPQITGYRGLAERNG